MTALLASTAVGGGVQGRAFASWRLHQLLHHSPLQDRLLLLLTLLVPPAGVCAACTPSARARCRYGMRVCIGGTFKADESAAGLAIVDSFSMMSPRCVGLLLACAPGAKGNGVH